MGREFKEWILPGVGTGLDAREKGRFFGWIVPVFFAPFFN